MMHFTVPSQLSVVGGKVAATLAVAALLLAAPVQAQDTVRYEAKPGSKVRIEGTSTIHDWTMDGQIIGGFLEVPAGVTLDQAQAAVAGVTGGKLNAHAESSIPIRSMKSA